MGDALENICTNANTDTDTDELLEERKRIESLPKREQIRVRKEKIRLLKIRKVEAREFARNKNNNE